LRRLGGPRDDRLSLGGYVLRQGLLKKKKKDTGSRMNPEGGEGGVKKQLLAEAHRKDGFFVMCQEKENGELRRSAEILPFD